MTDAGFLGADSVAWRVHSDASGMVGGIRSLMVQALQPRAMAGVAHHSDFRTDFWGRLQRTNTFLMTVVYGTREDAEQMAAVVRAVHRRVKGFDHFTKRDYAADEPELLTWVHNATVDSYLDAYRRHGKSLTSAEADQYISEMRVLGRLMGLDDSDMAHDERSLRKYFVDYEPNLAASPDAKEAVRVLLDPGLAPQVSLMWKLPAADAFASLPRDHRQMYGTLSYPPVLPVVRLPADVMIRAFRFLLPPPPLVEQAYLREGVPVF